MQKLISVASVEWQVRDLPRVHDRAELRAGGIDERRFGGHFDNFFGSADLQSRVDGYDLVEIDVHAALHVLLEAGKIELEAIGADRNLGKAVFAAGIGCAFAAHARGFVGERDLHVRKHCAAGIGNAAEDAAARALRGQESGTDQAQAHDDEPTTQPGRV